MLANQKTAQAHRLLIGWKVQSNIKTEKETIMSNTNENTQTKNRPTHVVKSRVGYGENVRFERLGVAFNRPTEGLYVKLTGKQVISGGFYLFPIEEKSEGQDAGAAQ